MPRVGVLANGTAEKSPPTDAFRQGLRDLGYVDGQNVALEIRGAEGHFERLPEMAVELVRWKPDVLVTAGPYGLQAARRATTAIPIVMIICDPAETVVERIARPSGHITGVTYMSSDLTAKRLQLLKEAVPSIRRVAVLYNPFDPQFRRAGQGGQHVDPAGKPGRRGIDDRARHERDPPAARRPLVGMRFSASRRRRGSGCRADRARP
jgi:putative ABC transport system substrate-binding protein